MIQRMTGNLPVLELFARGLFLGWVGTEFEMSERTALNFMQVAQYYYKSDTVSDLPSTVLYELCAPGTPDDVRKEVESRVAAGEKITFDDVKALKEQWAAERKDFARKIDDSKERERHARAAQSDIGAQLSELKAGDELDIPAFLQRNADSAPAFAAKGIGAVSRETPQGKINV